MTEARELAAKATALRDQSDALNLEMHSADITENERDEIAAQKRAIDAEAFDLEQQVREIGAAVDAANPDAVHAAVEASPLNLNGGGF